MNASLDSTLKVLKFICYLLWSLNMWFVYFSVGHTVAGCVSEGFCPYFDTDIVANATCGKLPGGNRIQDCQSQHR